MFSRLTRLGFVVFTTAACTVAFASTTADGSQDTASRQSSDVSQSMTVPAEELLNSDGFTLPERLLLAQKGGTDRDKDKDQDTEKQVFVYVCRVLRNGSIMTKKLLIGTALKLIQQFPNRWLLGRCEDVISPS